MSSKSSTSFAGKQGQYLAFIHTYTLLNRQSPAEADPYRGTGWNPAAERLFGRTAGEAVGQFLPFLPESSRPEFAPSSRSWCARGARES